MSDSRLLELLGDVDAYPADTDLPAQIRTRTVALQEIDRRIDMDTKERPITTASPQPRGWAVALAVFAMVVIAGAAVVALNAATEAEPASPPTTEAAPTTTAAPAATDSEIAAATVASLAAALVADINDGRSGSEIVDSHGEPAPGVTLSAAFGTTEFHDEWYDHMVAIDTEYELGNCKPVGTDGFATCELRSTSPHEPFYPQQRVEEYRLRVVDGSVVFAEIRYPPGETWVFAEVAFESWLREAHPDVAASMYTAAGANGFPAPRLDADPEAFTQNLIEYVAKWRLATEGS